MLMGRPAEKWSGGASASDGTGVSASVRVVGEGVPAYSWLHIYLGTTRNMFLRVPESRVVQMLFAAAD